MSHNVALLNPILNLLIEKPKFPGTSKTVICTKEHTSVSRQFFFFQKALNFPTTRQVSSPKDTCSLQTFSDLEPEIMSGMSKFLNSWFHPTGIQLEALFAFLWNLNLSYFRNTT